MDTERCPLCGKTNQCNIAAGRSDEPCWCFDTKIDPAALQRLTPEQLDRACLCPACAGLVAVAKLDEHD
ncbi:cysteine-rich CWC family protein [Pseudomonas mendocina]|nr:cysteine-rich CWC family protein [Pseudomonas mendocina]MBH3337793.1 cysteine-rich CWC family protein [Pseudomonas mendocina]